MTISGHFLFLVLALLTAWLVILFRVLWKLISASRLQTEPKTRNYSTIAGIGFAAIAVSALLALHLSWVSAGISQHLSIKAIRILSLFLFWSTLAGLLFCTSGAKKIRFLGIATCLVTGFWWLTLSMGSAISMGVARIVRHPVRYLIPEGYVGWVKIKHGEDADPLQMSNGEYICRIPANGILSISSKVEAGWARDEYFYYSPNGFLRELPDTGWGKGGMIWADHTDFPATPDGSLPRHSTESFYVGTEEQYHREETGSLIQSK